MPRIPNIFSVNPSSPLLPQEEDPLKRAIGLSGSIYDIIGKHYENKFREAQARNTDLEAQKRQGTLESDISAANTKNQTDIEYYPQLKAAELAKQGASIKEIQARTGLSYAETKGALARAANAEREGRSLGGNSGKIWEAYSAAPEGSQQKRYFGALLNKEMGGFLLPEESGASSISSPSGKSGIPAGYPAQGNLEINPIGGGARSTFHQAFDPITGKTIESPTINSASRNQMRGEAHSEMATLYPKIIEGLKPYQTPLGSLKLIEDARKASTDPEARKRIENYELAKRFLPELASINARQASGQAPGIEMNREFQQAMFPGLPSSLANYFIPGSARASANERYAPLQSSAVESALNQERQGYGMNGQIPPWAQQDQGSKGGFGAYGYVPPLAPAQRNNAIASGFNGNPNARPTQQAQQPQQSRTIGGNSYVKINGKWYHQ